MHPNPSKRNPILSTVKTSTELISIRLNAVIKKQITPMKIWLMKNAICPFESLWLLSFAKFGNRKYTIKLAGIRKK
jgi:hypothetical protein